MELPVPPRTVRFSGSLVRDNFASLREISGNRIFFSVILKNSEVNLLYS